MQRPLPRSGFTLLEMTIVIAMIGLLVGGLIGGKTMIRQSQVQSVITDLTKYKTATLEFRKIYEGLPGDLADATDYWGAEATCPGNSTTPSTGLATCNGDGDGKIECANGLPGTCYTETYRAWQHLANAKLINERFSGVASGTSITSIQVGYNIPSSRLNDAGFSVQYVDNSGDTNTSWFPLRFNNVIEVGKIDPNVPAGGQWNAWPVFTAKEMRSLDEKIDDGLPGSGDILTFRAAGFRGTGSQCVSSNDPSTATYLPSSDSDLACHLIYKLGF